METKNQQQWIASEIALIYKTKVKASLRPKIEKAADAAQVLRTHWNTSTIELFEEFKVLLVNKANRVLGICQISSGGIAGTVADPKIIFAYAIRKAACGIILCHNHPSGNLTPSQADLDITRKLKEGGRFLEIQILDHIILTSEKYYSFADEGLI